MKSKNNQAIEKEPKERYETQPTHLPGVELRREPGAEVDILRKTIDNLYKLSKKQAKTKWRIQDLTVQQDDRREDIIKIAKLHEGLRGMTSEKDNFKEAIFIREETTRDPEILKENLGTAYPTVVHETLVATFSVPVGLVTKKGVKIQGKTIEKAIRKAIVNLGIPRKDLTNMIHVETKISVDEEELKAMKARGQVELPPEAEKTEIIWNLRIDRLKP